MAPAVPPVKGHTGPPTITPHDDLLVPATSATGATVQYTLPTAHDAAGHTLSVSCAPASGAVFPIATTTVTCTTHDKAGNTAHSPFTVTVEDTTAPTITAHADLTVEATGPSGAAVTYDLPTATDPIDGTDPVACDHASGLFPLGATTVTCTTHDAAGNTAGTHFTVTVRDSTAPQLQLPAAITVAATGPSGATVAYTVSSTDLVDGTDPVTCAPASSSLFPTGTTTVTCSSHDNAGNTASGSFTVTVGANTSTDTTRPTIAAHANLTGEATGANGATAVYAPPTATDNVDGTDPVSCAPVSGSLFPIGATTVTCTSQDVAGNTAHSTFTVTIADTTPPTINAHANLTAEATGPGGAAVTYASPTDTDAVDGTDVVNCAPASGSLFPLGTTTVSCGAQDASGNSASASFTVTVRDTTAPQLQLPAAFSVPWVGPSGATVTYTATATDLVDGTDTVNCAPASGSLFANGTTTVTCDSHDAAGNATSGTFTATVGPGAPPDTTPPTITAHADVTAEATAASGATVTYTAPTATDSVDGSDPVNCAPASGTLFAVGTTTVTCTSQDNAGNVAHSTFTVDVQDTTPPTLAAHGNLIREATAANGATVTYAAPTATDTVDGTDAVDCAPASGSVFALGTTTVTCTSHDAAGNGASTSFTVSVRDTTAPTLSSHADLTREATSASGATVTFTAPTATDSVDGTDSVSCAPASGSVFALGATTVTCSTHDAAGNSASTSFTINVQDTTPPTIAAHADLTVEATAASGATVSYTAPVATDAVDGTDTVNCAPASGSLFANGTTTVTCSSHDNAGNTAHSTFTVLVHDTTAPTITAHSNLTREATSASGATVNYTVPTATDAVDGTDTVNCAPASGTVFALGTTTVDCTSHDAAGNTTGTSFAVTVRDTTAPQLQLPTSITVSATGPSGANVSFAATATDLVDGTDPVGCTPLSGSLFPVGTTTVSCTTQDAAGNASSGTFTVTVGASPPPDTTPPTIASHSNLLREATAANGATVSYTTPTARDNVDGTDPVSCAPVSGSMFAIGTTTVTCTSEDNAGNTSHSTFTVTVQDTTPPTIAAHGNVTAQATAPSGATVTYSLPTATDAVDGTDTVNCAPSSGSLFALGSTTVNCTTHDAAGNSAASSFTVTVTGVAQTISFTSTPPSPSQVGGSYTVTTTGGGSGNAVVLSIDASSTSGACSISGALVSFNHPGTCVIDANQAGNATYVAAAQASQTLTITKGSPVVSWSQPAQIDYGTALSARQLDATASVAGTLVYSPAAGTVLQPGTQTLTVTFTPTDSADWTSANGSVQITVGFTAPCVNSSGGQTITSGQSICFASGSQINGPVTVQAGGSLWIAGANISGPLYVSNAATLEICGTDIHGPVQISNDTGAIVIGNPAAGCAGDSISGPVQITNNTGGVAFSGNTVSGPITITGNTGGFTFSGNSASGPINTANNS